MPAMTAEQLKQRHRQIRDGQTEDARTRLHRAISWLGRSESETKDLDARFIFQWIALNAAYAREFSSEESERARFQGFVATLVALDTGKALHQVLFDKFPGPIRALIENKFVFEPFWAALRTHDSSGEWERAFASSRKAATDAIVRGETAKVLSIVFDRLYVLRNQLVHGGATWDSRVNRTQLKDATNILGTIAPHMISLMLDHPDHDFGEVLYPVV